MQHDELASVRTSGLSATWRRSDVDVALDDSALVIAWGRARQEHGPTDSQALWWVERYQRLGLRAPVDVGGGFGVVLVDRAARKALLWVDRFSIETICYVARRQVLGFSDSASEVPGSEHVIERQAIVDYFYFHMIPAPYTVFRDVRRVQHAHMVCMTAEARSEHAYWVPEFREQDRTDLPQRMRHFVAAIERAVAEEADEPSTACFLSGGTDSSTIAGMLTRVRGAPVDAYSIGFEAEGYDEMAYARIAAQHFGLRHHEYYVTPRDVLDAIPRIALAMDQPFGNSSIVPAYYCALRAREDGFTRMLAGDGGDELFAGNSRYAMQKMLGWYQRVPTVLRTGILEPIATGWKSFRTVPGLRQLGGYVRHSRVPMPERMHTFNLLRQIGAENLFAPEFLEGVDADHSARLQRMTWSASDGSSLVNRMLAYDWKFTLADSDLPKVRMATELAGVSVAYPFLSREMTELSLRIPSDWKLKNLRLRWFFKRALRDVLPREIIAKRKHGFGLPFGPWCVANTEMRTLASQSAELLQESQMLAPEFFPNLLRKNLAAAPNYYGELLWLVIMLAQWMSTAMDAPRGEVRECAATRGPLD